MSFNLEKYDRVIHYSTLFPTSPFRVKDWRWKYCEYVLLNKSRKMFFDDTLKTIFKFHARLFNCLELENESSGNLLRLSDAYPDLFAAWQIYTLNDLKGYETELQSRILAQEDFESISKKMNISKNVYDWYEKAFFDVKDRLNNASFIIWNVIFDDAEEISFEDEHHLLKFLAYFCGPTAVDYYVYRLNKNNFQGELTEDLKKQALEFLKLRFWALANSKLNADNMALLMKLHTILETREENIRNNDLLQLISKNISWQLSSGKEEDNNISLDQLAG